MGCHMLFIRIISLSLYICSIESLSVRKFSSSCNRVDSADDSSPNELLASAASKDIDGWSNPSVVAKSARPLHDHSGEDLLNKHPQQADKEYLASVGSQSSEIINRNENSHESLYHSDISEDFNRKEKVDCATDGGEKIEMHKNNHQSMNSLIGHSALSRGHLSNPFQLTPVAGSSLAHYSKILPHHSSSNIVSQSDYSLNYIHSLLSKPNVATSSLSNLITSGSNSIAALNPAPYSYSILGSSQVNPKNPMSSLVSNNHGHYHSNLQQPQQYQKQAHLYQPDLKQNLSTESGLDTLPTEITCGRQQVMVREPRVVGGNSTYEGEFPWAVSIQRHGNHHCGGVIVGRRWVLTAAHCVRSQLVGNLVVRTGGHTLTRSMNSISSHLERDYLVDQIVMHDDFSRYDNLTASQMKSSANTNNADIALLRLRSDIQWNELAWPVCFPNKESGNFSGHDATVIGWGKLSEKSEDFSNELQKVKLTIIDNKVCQNWFRQAGREMPIDDRVICAGFKNGGKDACHGDSGGPLLSKINGHYVVVGVVSTGIGCARPLLPGLYSRVSSYIGWIERYIN